MNGNPVQRRAFWKGAVVSSAATALVAVAICGLIISEARSVPSTSTAAVPATTETVQAPGPTVLVPEPAQTVALPGQTQTVTVTMPAQTVTAPDPVMATTLEACKTAATAGDKALNNYIRNLRLTSQAILSANQTGNPGPLNAAADQLQSTAASDRGQYYLFAAAREICLSGR